ncbi:MAG: S41 family peptidase [Planctomycetota bacterium]
MLRVSLFLSALLFSATLLAAPGEKSSAPSDDYYELYKVLVDTVDQVERNYVKEVDRRQLIEAAIEGVLSKLDPYSAYVPPEEFDRFRSGVESEFGGIGIQVSVDAGQLKIVSPLVGTPGYRAGLLAGDRIVEIDGEDMDGVTIDAAVRRLKGPEGTKVTLTVVHPGRTSPEKITVTRERIHVETVLGDRRKADDLWDFMLDPQSKIGYLRVSAFSRETPAEMRHALEELRKHEMKALILDLRSNPGGLLSAAIDVCDLFVASGRIVSTEGRNAPERVWNAHRAGTFEGFPMVVLVNRFSASASEIVAACLQDHDRAVVMGERTWGKGSVQNVIELEDGRSALKLTTAAYRRPNGKNIHRFEDAKETDEWGVHPTPGYELKLTDEEMIALVENRRERDIVRPRDEAPGAARSSTEAVGDTQARGPGAGSGEVEANPDKARSDSAAGADRESPSAKNSGKVGDRHLEMALKYLSTELAKAP